jgi:hypothetical protein
MKKLILIAIACFSILSACKKDEDPSKTDLLCGKYWKMESLTAKAGTLSIDMLNTIDACDRDDIMKFNNNGTYVTDTKMKCDISEPQSTTGTWSFNSDETILTQDQDSFKIEALTGSTMKLTYTGISDGVLVTITAVYSVSN